MVRFVDKYHKLQMQLPTLQFIIRQQKLGDMVRGQFKILDDESTGLCAGNVIDESGVYYCK